MRRIAQRLLFCIVSCLVASVAAAQPTRPTRTPAQPTPAQEKALQEGVSLHDEGKYDEAIAAYQAILDETPGIPAALYELAYSYAAKKDYQQSIATARRGAQYDSELLPLFYDVIAFSLDAMGEPRQAIDAYREGLALVPDASELYFNMGVTYLESLQDDASARQAFERSASLDPREPRTALLLGQLFQRGGYTTPALLALSTYLIFEPAGRTSLQGYGLWRIVLRGGVDDGRGGLAPEMAKQAPKTDEGDFAVLDKAIGESHLAAVAAQEGGTSEIRALVGQLDEWLGTLAERQGPASGFVDAHFVPFFVELKRRNYVEPFVYWVSQRGTAPGAEEWLTRNRPRVQEFLEWSNAYDWPKP
jgi:tetratricopeptide (TPR) repeat protein